MFIRYLFIWENFEKEKYCVFLKLYLFRKYSNTDYYIFKKFGYWFLCVLIETATQKGQNVFYSKFSLISPKNVSFGSVQNKLPYSCTTSLRQWLIRIETLRRPDKTLSRRERDRGGWLDEGQDVSVILPFPFRIGSISCF